MAWIHRVWAWRAGAGAYDWLTRQGIWHSHAAGLLEIARPLPQTMQVLDVGCGAGASAFAIAEALGPQANLLGVDLGAPMVAIAQANHRRYFDKLAQVRFEQADATALPQADGHFDLVVGHSFLYLCPDRETILAELYRVLCPGGQLLLMEPDETGALVVAGWRGLRTDSGRAWRQPLAVFRFVASMIAWRGAVYSAGGMRADRIAGLFSAAGFRDIETRSTLAGLGLYCRGVKPLQAA